MGVGIHGGVKVGRVPYLALSSPPPLLVDLSRLERGYPKEVGSKEADDLRVGLLDLSSTVIGDTNL